MKHNFNTLRFSANSVKFWLRPTLRKVNENFTNLGLTETLRKMTEILINTILTKTTEKLNTPGAAWWQAQRASAACTRQGLYTRGASWKLEAASCDLTQK